MKFYKLVKITESEYVERTRDLDYEKFVCSAQKANSIHPKDKNIYIAMQDNEAEINIDLDDFEEGDDE